MTALSAYMTTSNDGQYLQLQGLMGAKITIWSPDQSQFIDVDISSWPSMRQHCFNGTCHIDGTPNQSLPNMVPHYVYLCLKPGETTPTFNLVPRGFTDKENRYSFNLSNGVPTYTDPHGNVCTLLAMCIAINGSSISVLYGPGSRIATSSSPFLSVPSQALSAYTFTGGGSILSNQFTEIAPAQIGIYSCAWAWRGVGSSFFGSLSANPSGAYATVLVRPFARHVPSGQMTYGKEAIAHFTFAGQNLPIGGPGVRLAFDDGVWYFGLEGRVDGGTANLSCQHIVDGWV